MNPKQKKEEMKYFLQKENRNKEIKQVISISLKACDDDIGCIGEHYIVKARTENGIETCYVNYNAFQNYCNSKPDVIWKD